MKMSGSRTLTVVVTVHAEGILVEPTLKSVVAALQPVTASGDSCEVLIVADTATGETLEHVVGWVDDGEIPVRVIETHAGDPGSARNAGAELAVGEYIAIVDGDDLVSRNYFVDGLALLRNSSVRAIAHPETIIAFGARRTRSFLRSSNDPSVSYRDLLAVNLWPSSSISHRSVHIEIPHLSLRPGSGVGPEDWAWNILTASAGLPHLVVERTVYFYRTRASGGVNNRNQHALLPYFDVDALRAGMPRSATSDRPAVARLSRVASLKAGAWRMAARLPRRYQRAMRHFVTGARYLIDSRVGPQVASMRAREEIDDYLLEATRIEPAISHAAQDYETLEAWIAEDDGYGTLLDEYLRQTSGHTEALVMVPWIGVGGADLVSRNYMLALERQPQFKGRVSAVATYLPERTRLDMVPPGVHFTQLSQDLRRLPPERQHRLIAQFLVLARPRVVVGVNCFDLVQALSSFHRQIAASSKIYLTLFAFDRLPRGYPTNPITDDAERAFFDSISGIITDNSATKSMVDDMLGLPADFLRVHRQPALEPTPSLAEASLALDSTGFDREHPFRLLWPHRLDAEKRPGTLVEIASRCREENLPVQIVAYGQRVLDAHAGDVLKEFSRVGIDYRGPYSGGLSTLPVGDFHALLLTSAWEGLPLVLVQSMMLGLPVISTAVGGVGDLVQDGVTGLLVDGPDDIDGFIVAIKELMASRDTRRRLITQGYQFAVQTHSWEQFAATVEQEITTD